MTRFPSMALLLVLLTAANLSAAAPAAKDGGEREISLFDGKLLLRAAEGWVRKKPSSNIVEHEFQVPAAKGDEEPGRLTVMAAGGTIDMNVERWYSQFTQPDGKATKDVAERKKIEAAGQSIHLVDISGRFKDQRGPFAPTVERENYRMLAAIVTLKDSPRTNYFVKFSGPRRTVAEHEKAFVNMLEGLRRK